MWRFKTQGKSHHVYDNFPNILRVPKVQKGQEEFVKFYHELVTRILLGEQYHSPLKVISLEELNLYGFGLMQSDYSVSTTSAKVLTLEIKPKYAISNGEICDFCSHAFLKHQNGEKEFISAFCPFDLYSNNADRIKRAVHALFNFSRLKIFYNGVLLNKDIREEKILEMYKSAQDYLKDIVEILRNDEILKKLDDSFRHARNSPLKNFKNLKDKSQRQDVKQLLKDLESFKELDSQFSKFLISKSLMDVSIMIKIEDSYAENSLKIGVIDVQPKDFEKLPFYAQVEQEIRKVNGIRNCPIY